LLAGIAATLAQFAFAPHSSVPAVIVLGMWIALQLVSSVGSIGNIDESANTGSVAYMAHIGGFIVGFLMALLFRGARPPDTGA